jgi:hypothetical protein
VHSTLAIEENHKFTIEPDAKPGGHNKAVHQPVVSQPRFKAGSRCSNVHITVSGSEDLNPRFPQLSVPESLDDVQTYCTFFNDSSFSCS